MNNDAALLDDMFSDDHKKRLYALQHITQIANSIGPHRVNN